MAASRSGPIVARASASAGARVCLYSIPGAGKTTLIGTDDKTLVIRPPQDSTDPIKGKVDETIVDSHSGLTEVFQWGQQGGFDPYRWVWLDSLSIFQDVGMDDLFADAIARKPHRAEFGWDKQEYGLNQTRIGTWIRNMVGLATEGKMNFGITAHVMEWYDPVEEKDKWAPLIQGSEGRFMMKLMGMMTAVAYYQELERDGKVRRVLKTRSKGKLNILAKDQISLGGKNFRIVDPTMDDINTAIGADGRLKKATTTRRRRRRRKA